MKDKAISDLINGKVVLVTGGTGSFGNAFVERLLREYDPKEVIVLSRDEKKQLDMRNTYGSDKLRFLIGDVREFDVMKRATRGVDLIFHAAALKQVPTGEFFPMEMIRTNAIGAYNTINAAVENGVQRLVVLSTDKAVYPINVMGMTKALMERIMIAASREARNGLVFNGTRYGNVLYTRGSVVPFFLQLIQGDKPLTVTDKNMTRFMMTLEDSMDLVLYAMTHGKQGEMFVKKAPAATVGTIAQAMVELFNHAPGIQEIGIRPGEKMHEVLVSEEELFRTADEGNFYRITPEVPGMDYRKYYIEGQEKPNNLPQEGYTSANTQRLSLEETKALLQSLPEIKDIRQQSSEA